ncbi:MAG TPA: hypothetical protein VIT67_09405, partial [Povalibacter sp.]
MSFTRTIVERCRGAWRAVAGEISWNQPTWIRNSHAAVQRGTAHVRANPRRSGTVALAIVLVLAAGLLTWRWYQGLPKPVEIAFEVSAPAVTCYSCEPPGTPNPLVIRFGSSAAPLDRVGHTMDAQQAG